jgi:opacity protein-like surface antigen
VEYPEFAEYEPGPLVERVSLGLGVDYKLIKGVKLGLGYQFMSNLDTKYVKYLMRNRFTTSVTGKFDVDRFEFSLRERLQLTVKDDSKRLKSDGTIDTYKVNPELKWRNRFQVAYNIPKFKFDPTFSVESFFDLNNPDGNVFTKIRYKLAFDYKIQKHHVIDVFGVFNSVIVPDPEDDDYYGRYVLGVSYKYSF